MRAGENVIAVARIVVTALAALVIAPVIGGCGTSPAYRSSHPREPEGGIRVVPASQVKGTCQCDDDADDDDDGAADEARPRSRSVEYVKIREWKAPVAVREFEAENPPRGDVPASYTTFPQLTLHQPIPSSTFRTSRWTGAYPR